jgi:hypothetical protein
MNKLETWYAQQLEVCKQAGELLDYRYEAVRLHLGPGCWYTPDFLVLLADGTVELHEVKGHMEEAARVRLHTAAGLFPWFTFRLVRRERGGLVVKEMGVR